MNNTVIIIMVHSFGAAASKANASLCFNLELVTSRSMQNQKVTEVRKREVS